MWFLALGWILTGNLGNLRLTQEAEHLEVMAFEAKPYDRLWFEPLSAEYDCTIRFIESGIYEDTVILASGCNAVCIFVNDYITDKIASKLAQLADALPSEQLQRITRTQLG